MDCVQESLFFITHRPLHYVNTHVHSFLTLSLCKNLVSQKAPTFSKWWFANIKWFHFFPLHVEPLVMPTPTLDSLAPTAQYISQWSVLWCLKKVFTIFKKSASLISKRLKSKAFANFLRQIGRTHHLHLIKMPQTDDRFLSVQSFLGCQSFMVLNQSSKTTTPKLDIMRSFLKLFERKRKNVQNRSIWWTIHHDF